MNNSQRLLYSAQKIMYCDINGFSITSLDDIWYLDGQDGWFTNVISILSIKARKTPRVSCDLVFDGTFYCFFIRWIIEVAIA